MKVLLINQFFWPDGAATSLLLTDVACHLASLGHDVSVICGPSDYASMSGRPAPPVTIFRAPAFPFTRKRMGRLLSYASFYLAAIVYSFRVSRPDLVVTLTTPPMLSLVGTLLSMFRGSDHFSWEMDIYPEIAIDAGMVRRDSMLARLAVRLANYSRRKARGIIALGECMRERLIACGVPHAKISVAENWADRAIIRPLPFPDDARFCVLYSGNLGLVHEVNTIQGAMRKLKQDGQFRFVFAGFGARRKALEAACHEEGLRTVEFLPFQDLADVGPTLAMGHVGLVTQEEWCLGTMVPSKVYGVMAAGRPILFVGPATATPARIIQRFQCGWHLPVGDVDGLAELLTLLAADPERVRSAGARALEAFLAHYDRRVGEARITSALGLSEARPVWPEPEPCTTSNSA